MARILLHEDLTDIVYVTDGIDIISLPQVRMAYITI